MELDAFKIIRLMLPTLVFYYSVSFPNLATVALRKEAFGSADYYLDLSIDGIPQRDIQGGSQPESIPVTGVLASHKSEEKIHGKRIRVNGQTWYMLNTSRGRFTGWLVPPEKGCEPRLQFRIEENGSIKERGKLVAGFCP